MADTVKTTLLKAIEEQLNGIAGLATVKRWEDIPTDLSALELPVAFFWEHDEQEPYNRLTRGVLDFWVEVFFALDSDNPASYTAFSESAEEVAGHIKGLFAAPGELRAAGLILAEPGRVVKAKHNPEYGVLFMGYQLTYVHAAGNAWAINA